jgi:hypothetical protein
MLFSSSTARSSWQRSRNVVTRASKASRAAWSWRVPTPLAAASRARMAAFSASRASCAVRGSSVRTRSVEAAASVARLLRFLALWSSHARRMAAARTRSSPSTASHADSRRTASSSATWSMATTVSVRKTTHGGKSIGSGAVCAHLGGGSARRGRCNAARRAVPSRRVLHGLRVSAQQFATGGWRSAPRSGRARSTEQQRRRARRRRGRLVRVASSGTRGR